MRSLIALGLVLLAVSCRCYPWTPCRYGVDPVVDASASEINGGATLRIDVVPVKKSQLDLVSGYKTREWFLPPEAKRASFLQEMGFYVVEGGIGTWRQGGVLPPYKSADVNRDYVGLVVFADYSGKEDDNATRLVFDDAELQSLGWMARIVIRANGIAKAR